MEYLFFDTECANCYEGRGKICSLGYVLTDSEFREIRRAEIYMNPKAPFDYYVVKKVLCCDPRDYLLHPDFKSKYETIKELLTAPDRIVLGFGVLVDMEYIMCECLRYGLPFFEYAAFDVQKAYKIYSGAEKGLTLVAVAEALGINENVHAHRSEDDAYITMRIFKEIAAREKLTGEKFIEKYGKEALINNDGKILTNTLWKEILRAFQKEYKRGAQKKIVCIDESYEKKHPRDCMMLYDLLIKNGYGLDFYGNRCDIFLKNGSSDGDKPKEKKFRLEKIRDGTLICEIEKFIRENGLDVSECPLSQAEIYVKYIQNNS